MGLLRIFIQQWELLTHMYSGEHFLVTHMDYVNLSPKLFELFQSDEHFLKRAFYFFSQSELVKK